MALRKSKLQKRRRTKSKTSSRGVATHAAVLFRPERHSYVRGHKKSGACVFCDAVRLSPSPDSLLLYQGEHAIVVMNKYPYNSGHLLILPLRHCGDFLKLTVEETTEISRCLKWSVEILTDLYKPNGFNIGLNLGEASGAGIPEHLHYHVIPRWSGDTNFFPLIAKTKVVVETLEQTFRRLRERFEAL